MQYLLLIYDAEAALAEMTAKEGAAMLAEYGTFSKGIVESGQYRAGARLRPVSTATSVRVRDSKTLVTDGPFAETREQLGGYYLVDAANLDDAIAIAAKIPGARTGTIEVRPIWINVPQG